MSTVTTRLGLTKPAGVEQFNLATYNNNLDVIDTYASGTVDKMAKGLVSELQTTAASGAFSALSVVRNIATFTFKANRRYAVDWESHISGSADGDYADLAIQTCATTDSASLTTGLTMKRQITTRVTTTVNPFRVTAPLFYATDTTLQIKFLGTRTAGTGTITIEGGSARIDLIRIIDLGQQI